jgi:hypothetical protein
MSTADLSPAGAPKPSKRRARVLPLVGSSPTDNTASEAMPSVPITAKLLIDDAEAAALLGIKPGSVANLESRDPDFPKPIEWALDRKVRRRADVETYVAKLKQRRT